MYCRSINEPLDKSELEVISFCHAEFKNIWESSVASLCEITVLLTCATEWISDNVYIFHNFCVDYLNKKYSASQKKCGINKEKIFSIQVFIIFFWGIGDIKAICLLGIRL